MLCHEMPRKLTNFWIDPELLDGLHKVRERDGISLAEQYRRAVRLWLERKGIKADRRRAATRRQS
jgi:hypothetical protein